MAKNTAVYACSKCGTQHHKWSGRCLECGSWGTINEELVTAQEQKKSEAIATPLKTIDLNQLEQKDLARLKTGINELDRVFGGGLVPGSLILLGGEPGVGKSTLVGQIIDQLGENQSILYVSGEESAGQVKDRLARLKVDLSKLAFLNETNTEKIIATAIELKPKLLIIDSIQTAYSTLADAEAGSLSQIRASAVQFLELAKKHNIAVILVGHITKDGQIAGPKSLEHIVDVVLYLELENNHGYRILRASKNRFGSINELGVFEMTGEGFKEIKNTGLIFIDEEQQGLPGSVLSCVLEGSRPFLVEVQALVTKTVFGYPQRKASGFDLNRLQVLIAVLQKRAKLNLANQDIIINVVGGLKVSEPSLDLAVCLAIASSLSNLPISRQTIAVGEVGLGGEVRNLKQLETRLKEAEKLGFKKAVVPKNNLKSKVSMDIMNNVSELATVIKLADNDHG
jgi:DNA repair protein RadA/Sms